MATLKERVERWKESRSTWQKIWDILFWVLLILLILPGPRRVISTQVNRVALHLKTPGMIPEEKQATLEESDYEWELLDASGNSVPFNSFREKVIFLNFWATWCPPCVAELPEIRRAYEKHGDSVVFILATGQKPGEAEAFLESKGYELPVYYYQSAPPPLLRHGSIPTTYIISRGGQIAVKKKGAVKWDSQGTERVFRHLLK